MQTLLICFFFWWALLSLDFRIPVFGSNGPPALISSRLTPTSVSLRGIENYNGGKNVIAMEKRFSFFSTNTLDFLSLHISSRMSSCASCRKPRRPRECHLFYCGSECENIGMSVVRAGETSSLMKLVFTWRHGNFQKTKVWVTVTLGISLSWQDPFSNSKLSDQREHFYLQEQ